MKQKHIILILAVLLLNVYNKTWCHFSKCYKGIAYASFINAFYYYLFKRHLIWEFNPGDFSWRLLRMIHIFIVTPLLVLLCLFSFPKSVFQQVVHIAKWVASSTFVEHYMAKNKMIKYKYGWNITWSGILYVKMYVFSYLYMKRPILTWILTLFSIVFYMLIFKVPVDKRIAEGPYFLFFKKTKYPIRDRVKNVSSPYYIYFLRLFTKLKRN